MIVREAYAICQRLARTHYENFPVASHLLPRAMRPHIAAIYAFARTADDFADEGALESSERLARLDDWLGRLRLCAGARAAEATSEADAIFVALAATIRECQLPISLFEDLLSAFRQDVTVTRYESWPELLDYCRRSANPVGRLVLRVAGYNSEALDRSSDAVCTALQLTNFWQDIERDWHKGRVYVPLSDMRLFEVRPEDLDDRYVTPSLRGLLSLMAERTRALYEAGRPVCDGVTGRLRFELRMTWLGGRRILDAIERNRFDVFTRRPTLRAGDLPTLAWGALRWRAPQLRS